MAKRSNIFKASELIKEYPALGSSIAHDDFIHVCIVYDNICSKWTLISYVWDTRKIVAWSEFRQGSDMSPILSDIDELSQVSWEYMQELAIFADDNLQQLRFVTSMGKDYAESIAREDVLTKLNHEQFTAPVHVKIASVTVAGYSNRQLTEYRINGILICRTEVGKDLYCRISKNGIPSNLREVAKPCRSTCWYRGAGLDEIFGWHSSNWYDRHGFKDDYFDTKSGYTGSAISGRTVKELLRNAFNVA